MLGFRECSAEQGFTCLALPLKTAIMRPFRFPEMSPMLSICNQTCVLVKHQALLVIFVPQLSVLRLFLCRRPRWDKGLKPPYFRFSLRPVSSVLLLGCLKYPGQDALMQPWFRNCSRFMCSGSVLGLGVHSPTVHPPWAQPVASFLPSSSPCCSLSAVSDPYSGTPAPSSVPLQDFLCRGALAPVPLGSSPRVTSNYQFHGNFQLLSVHLGATTHSLCEILTIC